MHNMLTAMALLLPLGLMACGGGGECDGLDEEDCVQNTACESEYEPTPCIEPPCEEAFVACVDSSGTGDTD